MTEEKESKQVLTENEKKYKIFKLTINVFTRSKEWSNMLKDTREIKRNDC
jgi:hypothetical protein